MVDSPSSEHFTVMPSVNVVTNQQLAYLRLHGRNSEGYVKGRTVANRFDYDYSAREVKQIAERIRDIKTEVDEIHIIANNNRSNFAPKTALRLRQLLDVQQKLVSSLPLQKRLF